MFDLVNCVVDRRANHLLQLIRRAAFKPSRIDRYFPHPVVPGHHNADFSVGTRTGHRGVRDLLLYALELLLELHQISDIAQSFQHHFSPLSITWPWKAFLIFSTVVLTGSNSSAPGFL